MLFFREDQKPSFKKALARSRRHRGVSDFLTVLILLDDNTILHKDGALSRHFRYVAPDCDSSTDEALDANAQTWSQAFSFLGNGFMVETNVISRCNALYNAPSEFPDVVSALIDDERRLQYQSGYYFQTEHYLSITWKPEQMVASKLRQFALTSAEHTSHIGFEEELQKFNKTVNEFVGYLERVLRVRPLSGSELTTFLHQCITGHRHRLAQPSLGCFLDSYLASEDFIGGFAPKMGKKHIAVLAIDDLPVYSYPCILDALSYFPIEYRWSNRFVCLDPQTSKAYLKRYERNWSSKAIGLLGVIRESMGMSAKLDRDAHNTAEQLREAQTENSAGSIGYGFYNSNIILMHEDRALLDRLREEITTQIQQLDFRVRHESVNACEAFIGSIPGHGDYNLRKMMVDTNYIGHAFPISSVLSGEDHCSCPFYGKNAAPLLTTATKGSRPFLLNLHVGDVGHTAILGPTGKGKTTLTALLIASHRKYSGSRIIVLDKDYSNRTTIKALGGDYFNLAKSECQFGPLARIDKESPEHIDRAVQWLMDCCFIQGVDVTPAKQRALRDAVNRLAEEDAEYKNLNHLAIQDPEMREAISAFNSGQYQKLLNGTEVAFSNNDVIGFDMGPLVKTSVSKRDLAIPVIQAIFNEFEILFQDRRPTLLILEEAWLYLRHPLFQQKLAEWFKTLRKLNVAVIFISQDIDDIVQSEIGSVLQSSCVTRIYLPNESAQQMAESYRYFGLNDRQIGIISQAAAKRDYYYQSCLGNRLFQLDLGEVAKAFLCIDTKKDLEVFDQLYQKKHSDWVLAWLAHKKLSDWKIFAEQHYFEGKRHA